MLFAAMKLCGSVLCTSKPHNTAQFNAEPGVVTCRRPSSTSRPSVISNDVAFHELPPLPAPCRYPTPDALHIRSYTFGSPRVGNKVSGCQGRVHHSGKLFWLLEAISKLRSQL